MNIDMDSEFINPGDDPVLLDAIVFANLKARPFEDSRPALDYDEDYWF